MPQRAATIESLPAAFEVVKAMQAQGLDWGEGYRPLARQAMAEIIEAEMAAAVDRWLESLEAGGRGRPPQWLLSALAFDRARRHRAFRPAHPPLLPDRSGARLLQAFARDRPDDPGRFRARAFDPQAWRSLASLLGRPVSPATVSRVAQSLDKAVEAFHARPLNGRYKALMLDGVVLARKTGAGALRRPVLVALGLRHDGKKEVIDFRLARSESAAEWERFLADLYKRGLAGEGPDMICVDGG